MVGCSLQELELVLQFDQFVTSCGLFHLESVRGLHSLRVHLLYPTLMSSASEAQIFMKAVGRINCVTIVRASPQRALLEQAMGWLHESGLPRPGVACWLERID